MFGSGSRIMSDSWISWKPRIDEPSNPKPSLKSVLGQLLGGDREVLGHAGQVGEPHVDDLDALVLREPQHLGRGSLDHLSS